MHAERGGVAAVSVGTINVGPPRVAAWSAYRKQVERIAPPELVGREAELGELAAYCTEPRRAAYVWWRAPAWAGKSALISTFVLHPPAGVRVVAFFITARLGAQDTRQAFTEVVLEQLAGLLGQELPPWTASTRDAHLLAMLEHAAQACDEQGERLILVVDGLDEDRGVTTGPDAHSIAALLPASPPAGMRIVVAGRPDPPIPDDVPGWHPLRDPGIVRSLDPSGYAQDIKKLAQQELRRLLRGTPAQQDLAGLLTAARGGLSGPDLAHLTGEPPWEIEDLLHGVSGRTFTRRVSQWQPGTGPEVYLLGHEELQVTARTYFGGQRLAGYQDRLHAWAQEYQAQAWPEGTPEYLLSGYFRMLTATGDTTRLVACATDAARHERMLGITGGDGAALNEVTTTLDLITAQDDPDLTAALKLARHRDALGDRNTNIPTNLPAVWATLGHHIHAEALARSLSDPGRQARALAAVAGALAQVGQHEQAATVAARAESMARSVTDPGRQARALAAVAGALAQAGQHEQAATVAARAGTVAHSVTDAQWPPEGLMAVAGALAQAGQHEQAATVAARAETATRSHSVPYWRAEALAAVAGALARTGQHEQAKTVARSITDPDEQVEVLAAVAGALAQAGQHEQAETVARSITDPYWQARALAAVAGALAQAGQHEHAAAVAARAETVTRSITHPDRQAEELVEVAGALAQAGQHEQAAAVAARAESMARSITDPHRQAEALIAVAGALAQAGQHEQAETVTRSLDPYWQVRALAAVAGALAQAGQHEQAAAVAARAESMARSIPDSPWRVEARAEALAAGDGSMARSIPESSWRAEALAAAAEALAQAGQHEQAETLARSLFHSYWRARALVAVAGALAQAGQHEQAETVARSLSGPGLQMDALVAVAGALAQAGRHEQAAAVAARAETVARSITDPDDEASALVAVAGALAQAGRHEQAAAVAARAETATHNIQDPHWHVEVLAAVAGALAQAGQHEQAETVARSLDPYWQAQALVAVAGALAQAGHHIRAGALARSISDPYAEAPALVAVAEALAAKGDTINARHVASAACAVGRWTLVLRLVLSLEPSAVKMLTDL
ncbi:MAG: hypothetical protein ACRDPY_19135 [Streptosporangiaceae bacterium]